jgi:minor extracellular protease Epr
VNEKKLRAFYIITAAGLGLLVSLQAAAQLAPLDRTVDRTLERTVPRLEERVERRVREEAEAADESLPDAEALPADTAVAPVASGLQQAAGELADPALNTAGNVVADTGATVTSLANGVLREFVSDVDPFGRPIEANTLVVLVDAAQLADVAASGLQVISQRELDGIGLTLVTLRTANGYDLAGQALNMRNAIPGAAIDFNHLYQLQQEDVGTPAAGQTDYALPADSEATTGNAGGLRLGMIDSAVEPRHRALTGVQIVRGDFVSHEAERPLGHGTAVASLLAGAAGDGVEIYSASVFFQVPKHAPGASTESLVAALDWLAAQDVHAINMSLAGPANALLERAIVELEKRGGPPVIAAVGNNGPSGEPLYPGAYPQVLGVTAVDRENKIFRYANRGDHVDFAALGVNVKVADSNGGYRIESGTSMASPLVAALVAEARRNVAASTADIVAAMISNATDLGQAGFDPVFGHGLITRLPAVVSQLRSSPQD